MLSKFITASLRPLGMFFIFVFAALSILSSVTFRNVPTDSFFGKFVVSTVGLEDRFYDYRMTKNLEGHPTQSKEQVLIEIDDSSLQKIGVWPLPRTTYADMLKKLKTFGAKVVAFDVLFPEKAPVNSNLSPDTVFANAIRDFQQDGRKVFIGYSTVEEYHSDGMDEAPTELFFGALDSRNVAGSQFVPQKINKYTFPIQELVEAEVGLGYLNSLPDTDGVFRRYRVAVNVDTIYLGSLGWNAWEAYMGGGAAIKISQDNTGEVEVNGKMLELNSFGEAKLRYIGSSRAFKSVSLYDVLSAPDDDEKLKEIFNGKIVFLGSTAEGAHDFRPSPIDPKMPGVYSHMNFVHMMLNQYFYKSPSESENYSIALLLLGMLIFIAVQRSGNPFVDAVVVTGLIGGSYYADMAYFLPEGYELKLFYCYFCFVACYSWNTFLKFHEANKEKKQIKGTFARYVAPTVVDEMLKDPSKLQIGGQKKDITCLFSDVRDFTSISEGLSATELSHSMNTYMTAMTNIVFQTKGTLDKYIGDAIVALWGAPIEIGNHAQYAVEAAIQMINQLPTVNEEFKKLGRPEFKVGIGLNSGECSVGNMGSELIFSYTALGDNMNLGARVESLCKRYGAQILITDFTLERLDLSDIKYRPVDKVIVKGKTVPVGIHEVLHEHHYMTKDPESHTFYMKALEEFQKKNFTVALEIFSQLVMVNEEDKASKRYKDLCKAYLEKPELVTETFDVTVMTEK